jgi:hypothetical protein
MPICNCNNIIGVTLVGKSRERRVYTWAVGRVVRLDPGCLRMQTTGARFRRPFNDLHSLCCWRSSLSYRLSLSVVTSDDRAAHSRCRSGWWAGGLLGYLATWHHFLARSVSSFSASWKQEYSFLRKSDFLTRRSSLRA